MKTFYCAICNAPMKLIKKLSTIQVSQSHSYHRNKYQCIICDFVEVIYAGGNKDKNELKQE